MNLTLQTPFPLLLLLIIAAIVAAYVTYRYTVPPVSATLRWILTGLRAVSLSLILLAVSEPLLQLISTSTHSPVITLLVDHSLSMAAGDSTGEKERRLRSLVEQRLIPSFSASADLRSFRFSSGVTPLNIETFSADGAATNISGAIRSALSADENVKAVLLVTDGNYTMGSNPLYDAEKSRVPIFTIGVGDTADRTDIAVARLTTNAIGYAETAVPVEGTIRSSNLRAGTVVVSLSEDGKKIDEQIVELPPGGGVAETPFRFSYTPRSDGIKKITVSVPSVAGDFTEKNNRRSAIIKVLKNKMAVTVIAGAPNADVSAVMQALRADENISAVLFYQTPGGDIRSPGGDRSIREVLPVSDAAIFIGYPARSSSAELTGMIVQEIERRSIPVFFIAARTMDLAAMRSLEHLFPFMVQSERMDEQPVRATVPKNHPLLEAGNGMWEKLPPLFHSLATLGVKPEAQTLLTVTMQNVPLPNPLFVIRNIGTVKSAAFLGYGLHRWKVLAGGDGATREFFDRWFTSLIRWLAVREQDKFFRLEPSRQFYSRGEAVEFSGQVYDERFQPVDDADVRISLRSLQREERIELPLLPSGSGMYEGSTALPSEGDYRFDAAALRNGDTVGTASGRISIGEQSAEFAETKMNRALLGQIALLSGGEYRDASATEGLAETILSRPEMKSESVRRTQNWELWNLPSFLALVVLLLGAEWIVRKRNGML